MELDDTVPPSEPSFRAMVPSPDDPYVADLLQVADDKIASLTSQLHITEEERDGLQVKINSFRKQVTANWFLY